MEMPTDQYRSLGETGLRLPPIVFGAAPLGNIPQAIPEQRKLELCGEWLRSATVPAFVNVDYRNEDGLALELLGRLLRRLEVAPREIVIHLTIDSNRPVNNWEESCRLLGAPYRPTLLSLENTNGNALKSANEIKRTGDVIGIGVITPDLNNLQSLASAIDWVVLTHGFSLLRHSPGTLALMSELRDWDRAIIVRGIFERGFLLGGNRLDGQIVSTDKPADHSLLAWRTSLAALCHGHGVAPAHACIQFALSGPGVAALLLTTSHPDRVAENVHYTQRAIPDVFWASLQEEGLLAAEYPI